MKDFSQVANYIRNLIEDRGLNTLYFVLREKDLCNDLKTSFENKAGIKLFRIECDLTNNGFPRVYSIVTLIFQVKFVRILVFETM